MSHTIEQDEEYDGDKPRPDTVTLIESATNIMTQVSLEPDKGHGKTLTNDDQATTPERKSSAPEQPPTPASAARRNRRPDEPPPPPTVFSECLYGVPEDDDVWEAFFAQPDEHITDVVEEEERLWKRQARVRGHAVQLPQLRRLAATGIPDEGSHRGVVWRLLLGPYLPPDNIDDWPKVLYHKRSTYQESCQKYFSWNDWEFGHVLRVQRKQEHIRRMMQQQQLGESLVFRMDTDDEYNSIRITATNEPRADVFVADESSSHTEDDLDPTPSAPAMNTRPVPTELFDNSNVLELIPDKIQKAWVERGKDLHILQSLMRSFNALRMPQILVNNNDVGDGEKETETVAKEQDEAVADFVHSAILLDEIHKDVVRTHSDLAFFLDPHDDLGRRRYAAIERVLFLWAKHNANNVRYVQGMNEIVGALYYVLANDWRTEWANAAEPDSYYLLEALLDDFRDVFVPELDAVDTGIRGRISALQDLLERHDPHLQEHFSEIGIDASFYAVRWLTTLLSREFLLPDTIRLWDSMFASTHKDNFLRYVCVTMLFQYRDRLLRGDFAQCIKLLQQYPPVHMDKLLEASRSLYMYETQIAVACHRANLTQHDALLRIPPPPNLIMAFGFERGIVPPPQLTASEHMQNATTAMAKSARTFFGGMFARRRSQTGSTAPPPAPITPPQALTLDEPESPDIYMQAILQSPGTLVASGSSNDTIV